MPGGILGHMSRRLWTTGLLASTLLLAGCSGAGPAESPSTGAADTPAEGTSAAATPVPTETPTPAPAEEPLAGFVVAVDPGHNGGNAAHPAEVTAPVPDGRGGTKACNTTGTASASDYPEHAFTWGVAGEVRERLEDLGAEVVLSREDDEGVGPCVDERGQFAAGAGADVLVSIHANGTEDTSAAGFHMIVVEDSPHAGLDEPSRTLAEDMVEAFGAADLSPNPAYGDDGIVARTDIAGLNHAEVPAVLVECGEMRNPDEAALMESAEGRERYAAAIVAGVEEFLTD